MSNGFDYKDLSQRIGEDISDILYGSVDEAIKKLKKIKKKYGGDATLYLEAGTNNIRVGVKKYENIEKLIEETEDVESLNNELKKMSKTKNRP